MGSGRDRFIQEEEENILGTVSLGRAGDNKNVNRLCEVPGVIIFEQFGGGVPPSRNGAFSSLTSNSSKRTKSFEARSGKEYVSCFRRRPPVRLPWFPFDGIEEV